MEIVKRFWNYSSEELLQLLNSSSNGLSTDQAIKQLSLQKKKNLVQKPWINDLRLLVVQFKSPLVLLLVFAVTLSAFLGEYSDSLIVLVVLLTTGTLGFVQERNAGRAVEKLKALVNSKATVRRRGVEMEVMIDDVVEGDIVLLNAGNMIPADAVLIESNDLHVNESVLTGESFPVEKFPALSTASEISKASNAVFKGTSVISGSATALAVRTGGETELGKIAVSLSKSDAITSFEKGILAFGKLLIWLTVIFSGLILLLNIFFHRPFIDSLLFALALAVGITPELLPAILTITLAAGARKMATQKVIVKKLSAIQNLGEIDILCSDKTGTITQGVVSLQKTADCEGNDSERVLRYAFLNAFFETGFTNPIDESVRQQAVDATGYTKCDEVPYDFIRKRLSVVVEKEGQHIMVTKGSVKTILDICDKAESSEGVIDLNAKRQVLQKQFEQYSEDGSRVIAVAYKDVTGDPVITKDDEVAMIFLGFLLFADPLKEGILEAIKELRTKGVALKIITGDNYKVAQYITKQLQLDPEKILTGSEMADLTFAQLVAKVEGTEVFAEIIPAQKESIINAFKQAGHSVGYLGDGINDANALKAADVGISVEGAVDVAKEAADLVLLDKHIEVVAKGIVEGRKTFMNTLKYIFVTTSANFGNMFSMAVASLFLPFMPLLPVQILLNNFLSDLPAIGIASDKVDEELITGPRKWNMGYIKRFMIVFGLQSSLFDFITFGLLYFVYAASPQEFRTAWFCESLLTEILILLVIRTKRPFFKSSPSRYLIIATLATFALSVFIPYLPFSRLFMLYPLPLPIMGIVIGITVLYIFFAEQTKKYLFKGL
ncbi:MAG: magnesium-translocating P-type ATPase [Chitinophagaceae bacterium]|nr:MAG: magnesium-translocating P-type ATPase [Chitinophagaceae bacterium]